VGPVTVQTMLKFNTTFSWENGLTHPRDCCGTTPDPGGRVACQAPGGFCLREGKWDTFQSDGCIKCFKKYRHRRSYSILVCAPVVRFEVRWNDVWQQMSRTRNQGRARLQNNKRFLVHSRRYPNLLCGTLLVALWAKWTPH